MIIYAAAIYVFSAIIIAVMWYCFGAREGYKNGYEDGYEACKECYRLKDIDKLEPKGDAWFVD